jgi:penicillin-binding protein 2
VRDLEMDRKLYEAAEKGLGDVKGAVIVTDPTTGRIRAVVERGVSILEPYPPGSLVKLVTVWVGLERGLISPETVYGCTGSVTLSGRELTCWYHGGHGELNLVKAICYSCNVYFYNVAERMGAVYTYLGLKELGFGGATGIELSGGGGLDGVESRGTLLPPDPALFHDYVIGDTDLIAATPLQVITYLSALVNGGRVFRPCITKTKEELSSFTPKMVRRVEVSRSEGVIKEGMLGAIRFGTAVKAGRGVIDGGIEVIGKTGTGGFSGTDTATHGWFLGFAPKERPEIGVLVFVYRGTGGEDAAPIAREVFRAYFGIEDDGRGD